MNPANGLIFDYFAAFLGGILVSFTPCVYPLIPLSAGYVSARSAGSRLKGFLLSVFYVTGLAVTYSALGLIASLTGSLFGSISSHPAAYFFSGTVIIIFGLAMADFLPMPQIFVIKKTAVAQNKGYFSSFLLGLASGLMISPCISPVLGSILVYLSTKNNLLYGTTLLFVFAYGMGLVMILVSTFSAVLISLPKSGKWMVYIKKACALILMLIGAYFVYLGLRRI